MDLTNPSHTSGQIQSAVSSPVGTGPSPGEIERIRRRRKLARKTPEQRRKLLQYQRRHNEKDGRMVYCDYCDIFVSSRQKTWHTHLRSARHLDNFHSYYDLVAHVESVWLGEIQHKIDLARSREVHRVQQQRAGEGASTPLHAQQVAPGIVVGGPAKVARTTSTTAAAAAPPAPAVLMPAITIGGKTIVPPVLPSPAKGSDGSARPAAP